MEGPDPQDDVELSDLEDDAFISNGRTARRKGRATRSLTRWMPSRARKFVENLSRIKLVIILLCIFLITLVILGYINSRPISISIPPESLALSTDLAKNLSETAIPQYVLTYAPLVILDNEEKFYPSDMAFHISNTYPALNFTPIIEPAAIPADPLTLDNLHKLNDLGGEEVYLTSILTLDKMPKYLRGKTPNKKSFRTDNAISSVIIVTDKGNGILDAFYMYFYTFNGGPTVFGHTVGDHLGDWEHNMIRFENGIPLAVWYSQHEYGEAFTYKAVQKAGKRPLGFSAKGSHANYAVAGSHDLHKGNDAIPENVVFDRTSQGHLWDPTLSAYYYTYSVGTETFTPVTDETPVNYLYFNGRWGDKEYPDDFPAQSSFHDVHKWTSGPQGPLFKHLDREDVCLPRGLPCVIKSSL